MQIDGKHIGGHSAWIICEIGHNHGGSLNTAKRLIDVAAEAGADAVKFQLRDNRNIYTKAFYEQPYASENAFGPTYGSHREALELSMLQLSNLQAHAAHAGITMFATAFDELSVDKCVNLGFPAIKIASGDLTNTPLIAYAADTGLPLIISTGGGTWTDIDRAFEIATLNNDHVALLQCTASYPSRYEDLNLGVIPMLAGRYTCPVGASLHDNGIAMAVAAYCMGAQIIEKHITLDRTMKGTDHAFSLEPQGLRKLVRDLRRCEVAMGTDKGLLDCEREPLRKMGKSVRARHQLSRGHVLTATDLAIQSPADPAGLAPWQIIDIVGRPCPRDLEAEDLIPQEILDGVDHAVRTA